MSHHLSDLLKTLLLLALMIVVIGFTLAHSLAQQYRSTSGSDTGTIEKKQTDAEVSGEVKIEKIKEGEWKIINRYGDFVGTLQSDSKMVFQIYDTGGLNMGRITESGIWYPRNYQGRDTKIVSREVYLYLDALEAIEKIKSAK